MDVSSPSIKGPVWMDSTAGGENLKQTKPLGVGMDARVCILDRL